MFFFFNDTATTEIYTLSLHDALPISTEGAHARVHGRGGGGPVGGPGLGITSSGSSLSRHGGAPGGNTQARGSKPWLIKDRKSTRLNSRHANISYAVFCLKKKKHEICR